MTRKTQKNKTTEKNFIDWRYLTTQEANQSINEGCTKEDLQLGFCISKAKLEKLLSGKIKKFKIPKPSMWYEQD